MSPKRLSKKRLTLINPVNNVRSGFAVNPSSRFPPLGLGILASLTPDDWEVELLDENFAPFSYRDADLVGITAFTSAANRAYEIASIYRDQGVPVVMGGIHASMCSDEALRFADAVVVGEAESVWRQVLADAQSGRLRGLYHGQWLDPDRVAPPRRDIYSDEYVFASVQTSRGCPLDCEFCSVTAYNGRRYRRRPVADVLDELETLNNEMVFFVDDNIIGNGASCRKQALELFQGMVARGMNKTWFCQASISVADDAEVLDWAARAGCRMIFIGIEAEDIGALTEVNKRLNLKKGASAYQETFDRIHASGISVLGAFIFGMDSDTPEALFRRAEFMVNSDVDAMQLTTMTPLPGTRLFQRLEEEERLLYTNFPNDWAHYDLTKLVHRPKSMPPDELWDIIRQCTERVYDLRTLKTKAKRTLETTGSMEATEFAYRTNINYRNIGLALGTLV
ncbi:B12-binding domain-containing radical SAM protein [Crateriforma conspicua]|nr:radical SAM protein [Crateriforma conspicua]